jgi:methyl-accepting chemotaxis protein
MNDIPTSSDLSKSVAINQGLKQVVDISHQINLVAMNAILVAKRAGAQSAGFKVVAMELRIFSQKMEESMDKLSLMIFQLVHRIADLRKLEKNLRSITETMQKNANGTHQFEYAYTHKQSAYQELKDATDQEWQTLEKEIRRSLNLCSSGAMLSHNARIEAAYGGSMLADMQQVAGRIEEIMNQAIFHLKQLTKSTRSS